MNPNAPSTLVLPLAFAPYSAITVSSFSEYPGSLAGSRVALIADAAGCHRQGLFVPQGTMILDSEFNKHSGPLLGVPSNIAFIGRFPQEFMQSGRKRQFKSTPGLFQRLPGALPRYSLGRKIRRPTLRHFMARL